MRKGTKIIVHLQIFFTFEFISAAKVLYQTAKTCQYAKKNALFLRKSAFFILYRSNILVFQSHCQYPSTCIGHQSARFEVGTALFVEFCPVTAFAAWGQALCQSAIG